MENEPDVQVSDLMSGAAEGAAIAIVEDSSPETFFTRSAGLGICINPGRRIMTTEGTVATIGYKFVQFSPTPDHKFGQLMTSDPEVKAALRSRPDIFDGAEYARLSTPPEVRNQQLVLENRRLTEENRLLQELSEQGKLPSKNKKQ